MELAREEVGFAGVLSSLKPGGVYAVPEGSHNPAGVWATRREMYCDVDHSKQLALGAGR